MISFELGVDDLADTRFAISPIHETVISLRILRDPGLNVLHLPWRRRTLSLLAEPDSELNADLLISLVGTRLALPDFLTPQPAGFVSMFSDELAVARQADPKTVRRDFVESLSPLSLPGDDDAIEKLRDAACDQLDRFWTLAIEPFWPQMRLVMEADMTYRARQLALGGARLLFADMHPNLRWKNGVLYIDKMIGNHHVVAGRGLHLMPSVFSHKPAPAVSPESPPGFAYPSRGIATLWEPVPPVDTSALSDLLGRPRANLLGLLEEPLSTTEIARRLRVTPSAVNQHLQVLHSTGLVTRTRDGRRVLYHRSALGDQLATGRPPTSS